MKTAASGIFLLVCSIKVTRKLTAFWAPTFSPGVVAVVLGDTAAVVWVVGTLPFVGTPLGTEVVVCIFTVLFTGTGLTVGNTSEE